MPPFPQPGHARVNQRQRAESQQKTKKQYLYRHKVTQQHLCGDKGRTPDKNSAQRDKMSCKTVFSHFLALSEQLCHEAVLARAFCNQGLSGLKMLPESRGTRLRRDAPLSCSAAIHLRQTTPVSARNLRPEHRLPADRQFRRQNAPRITLSLRNRRCIQLHAQKGFCIFGKFTSTHSVNGKSQFSLFAACGRFCSAEPRETL